MGVGKHRVLEAEPVERVENVGAELDAGADLAKLGGLLDHPHRKALARQRVRRRQAPDAAASDQDRQFVRLRHRHSKRRNACSVTDIFSAHASMKKGPPESGPVTLAQAHSGTRMPKAIVAEIGST